MKLEQRGLADATNVPVQTLKRYEGGVGPLTGNYQNISSIVSYLESSGIIFLEHDQTGGPGVRLRGSEGAGT